MFTFLKTLLTGAGMGLLAAFPLEAAAAALSALRLFAAGVLPALLPFSVCALLLTAGKRLPLPALALLALPAGSPAGARLFQDAGLTRRQARRYAACTGCMSPMFFLYTLAQGLGSPSDARLLLAAHLLACLLCALPFPGGGAGEARLPALSAPQAVTQAAQAMPTVAACMMLGAAAARLMSCALPSLPAPALAALQSLLEVTGGCRALIALALPRRLLLPLLAACTGFTGGAILLQNAAFWRHSGLSLADLVKIALLRALAAFLMGELLVYLPFL